MAKSELSREVRERGRLGYIDRYSIRQQDKERYHVSVYVQNPRLLRHVMVDARLEISIVGAGRWSAGSLATERIWAYGVAGTVPALDG